MPSLGCLFLSRGIRVRLIGTIRVGRKTTCAGVVDTTITSDLLSIGSPVVVVVDVDVVEVDVTEVVVVDVVEVVVVVVVVTLLFRKV